MEDYIGETKRILGTHLKELRLQWTSLPLLSMPAPSISIVDQAKKYKLLQLKEALHILLSEQKRLMNRDQGTYIDGCLRSLLRRVHRPPSVQDTSQPPPV